MVCMLLLLLLLLCVCVSDRDWPRWAVCNTARLRRSPADNRQPHGAFGEPTSASIEAYLLRQNLICSS